MNIDVSVTTLFSIFLGTACYSAHEIDGADGDAAGPESDDTGEFENDNRVNTACRDSENCGDTVSIACDSLVGGFKGTMEEILQRASLYDPSFYESTRACITAFDECLLDACPPETTASSWKVTRACSSRFSMCLTVAAPQGLSSVPHNAFYSMPARGSGYSRFGIWYDFADSDYGGGGASEIEWSILAEGVCVHGVASREENGLDAVYWGAGFGGNLNRDWPPALEPGEPGEIGDRFLGVTFKIEGHWGDELRVLFHEDISSGSGPPDQSAYIVVPPDAAMVTALVDQAEVWYNPGNMLDVETLDAIQFQVATNPQAPTPFDFCISELAVIFGDTPSNS